MMLKADDIGNFLKVCSAVGNPGLEYFGDGAALILRVTDIVSVEGFTRLSVRGAESSRKTYPLSLRSPFRMQELRSYRVTTQLRFNESWGQSDSLKTLLGVDTPFLGKVVAGPWAGLVITTGLIDLMKFRDVNLSFELLCPSDIDVDMGAPIALLTCYSAWVVPGERSDGDGIVADPAVEPEVVAVKTKKAKS
jgi:hypothetical protein